ncbi:MAG: GDSL-type esterase/lipase family protein [Bdellovibrionales bacterium]|jgi:lysophospholipase L1-like esterase|nr:GDSL-type esterase/lipase family protein [Bdellovibrionales bacterium]
MSGILLGDQAVLVLVMAVAALVLYVAVLRRRLGNVRSFTSKNLFYRVEIIVQSRRAAQMNGGVAFIGDSMIAGLATSRLPIRSENFGIGGETIEDLQRRLSAYDLTHADTIVVLIGINNFAKDRLHGFGEKYRRLLAQLPAGKAVIAVSLLPLNRKAEAFYRLGAAQAIAKANGDIENACNDLGCRFLNLYPVMQNSEGELRNEYAEKDGLHLSVQGYAVLCKEMEKALLGAAGTCGKENKYSI